MPFQDKKKTNLKWVLFVLLLQIRVKVLVEFVMQRSTHIDSVFLFGLLHWLM